LAKPPGLEPLQLLGDGGLDDRSDVAVGYGGSHERPKALELLAKLGRSREVGQ
jgi:hypothetical protein